MGLLSKIFGNDDDTDLKYVLFAAFSSSLANADGEMTNKEVQVINNYLSSVPGMTEQRQIKIIKKANSQSQEAFKSAQALNEKDKLELVGLLVNVACADGYFHGEEASYIIKFSVDLGFNPSQITDYIMDNFDINIDEFVEASKKRLNLNESEILALKTNLLRTKTEKKQEDRSVYKLYEKSQLYLQEKEWNNAIKTLNLIIDIVENTRKEFKIDEKPITEYAPEDMSYSFNIVDLYHKRGCAKFSIKNIECIKDFNEAINLSPNYSNSYYMRAVSSLTLINDWESSLSDIKKFLILEPSDEAGNNLSNALNLVKDKSVAINKQISEGNENFEKGEELLEASKDKEASEFLNKAVLKYEKAILSWDKNHPYLYEKSHSTSLPQIMFKKIQCRLHLKDEMDIILKECLEIYKTSAGRFNPKEGVLGAKIYSMAKVLNDNA